MPESHETQPLVEESAVRRLRDNVFGKPTNDDNWFYCKEHWMRSDSVKWLQEKLKTPLDG